MTIETEGLAVHFRRGMGRQTVRALDGVDILVSEGDFFALLGENGAGKSTAMGCLLGLVRPTAGRVRVFGREPSIGSAAYRHIGYLPEEPHYHDYLTIEEAVAYYGALTGAAGWPARADALVERLGLSAFRKMRLARCSKGMKQKLGIVQCLLGEPRLLLLDEPMRGLDPVAVREFRDILVDLNKRGVTVVMNSHILSEVEMVATRVAILRQGRVVAQGRVRDLLSTDHDAYEVEVAKTEGYPAYFEATGDREGPTVEGVVPLDRLYDFLDFTRARDLRVFRCALRRSTLEDAFLRIVRPGAADA